MIGLDFQIDFQVPNFKSVASSDFQTDCKFRISNRFLLLIFKPISKKGEITMNDNKISINLQFKEYEFRRVKYMGSNPVVYTTQEWIGKMVLIIPVPLTVTDRWIESQYDEKDECYKVNIESDIILKKRVMKNNTIGRVYVNKDWGGLDCLIIEAPYLDNF